MDKIQQINCSFTTASALYAAYMPFVKGGGIFIRSQPIYQLGTPINLSIMLMDENESYDVVGKVVWITPKGAQANKVPGIGVQFLGENSCFLRDKIETYLIEMLNMSQLTDTI